MTEYLILVDEKDQQWGKLEKLLVHELGLLHRAFSVFIFNSKGELLLQQRADSKYHSAGLWTNTCCSHPRFGEEISWAIESRVQEEMEMSCKTDFAFNFIYKTEFENGLTEHEFDHVYFGVTDDLPFPEKAEVKNYKYMNFQNLETNILIHPENYTGWLKICLPQVRNHYYKTFQNIPQEYASI
ncbi:MAG: isopentenyl-diphosphate Delta-isomerase [Fimbriimonadaceae bacterium]|nr:isopentenyl-diphosphate Delta-isomerase [Chitinophagales bacterium]